MQKIIDDHVMQNNRTMYDQATKQVQKSLNKMSNNYQKDMATTVDNTVDSMVSDYKNCIMKRDLPAASLTIRREIIRIISKVDDEFRLQVTPEPSEAKDMNTEQKASGNDTPTQAPVATTAMDIDESSNEPPEVSDDPVSPQNGKTNNSQKPKDSNSGTIDQVMGGTNTT